LNLRDQFGNLIQFNSRDFSAGENFILAQVDVSGTYYIDVNENGTSPDYTLTATSVQDDFVSNTGTTGTVEVGGSTTGTLNFEDDSDWFAIELTAGDTIRISSEVNLTLLDGFANFVERGFRDFSVGENVLIAQVEESGTFFIAADGFGSPVDYTITATEIFDDFFASTVTTGRLEIGGAVNGYTLMATALEDDFANNIGTTGVLDVDSSVTGSIDFSGDSDWFAIELTAGEVVRISSDGFDANLLLRDGNGDVVTSDFRDFSTDENVIIAQVEQSGTFYVDVSSFNPPVDYTLTTTVIEDDFANGTDTTGVLELGVVTGAVSGTLEFQGDQDWFEITINDTDLGVRFSIDLFDADLLLFDADGARISSNVDGQTLNFDTPGTYFLAAGGTFNVGEYTLRRRFYGLMLQHQRLRHFPLR